jgi:hypothetical protein
VADSEHADNRLPRYWNEDTAAAISFMPRILRGFMLLVSRPTASEEPRMPKARMVIAGLIVLTYVAGHAEAAAPPDADPALAPWFNGLRQPWTNALCCSVADCRPVDSRLHNGRYEALIEGEWRAVPDDHILNRADNPTGRAVACWTPQAGIICFVRAPDS